MMRNSFKHVPYKHIKEFIEDLKQIYTVDSLSQAEYGLALVQEKWSHRYPLAVKPWVDNWHHVSTFFEYPPELRKIIYTTNAVEGVHRQFRKVTKNRSVLANDEALFKLLYLKQLKTFKKTYLWFGIGMIYHFNSTASHLRRTFYRKLTAIPFTIYTKYLTDPCKVVVVLFCVV